MPEDLEQFDKKKKTPKNKTKKMSVKRKIYL